MPHRLLSNSTVQKMFHIDYTMIVLNVTSVGTLALSWLTEHLTSVGGFLMVLSIAVLNIAKAYSIFKKAHK